MQIGVVGLGRMGADIVRRLQRDGHACVAHDVDGAMVERLAATSGVRPRSSPKASTISMSEPAAASSASSAAAA
jgi:6-phosphogluconate dehydrogenase